jgi:hypothetical protein
MGDYYNSTRGPLTATLTDGAALSISPKAWIYISPENESSASILKLLGKGFLVRSKVPMTPTAVQPKVVARPVVATPAKIEKPVPALPSVSTSPMKEEIWRKKK